MTELSSNQRVMPTLLHDVQELIVLEEFDRLEFRIPLRDHTLCKIIPKAPCTHIWYIQRPRGNDMVASLRPMYVLYTIKLGGAFGNDKNLLGRMSFVETAQGGFWSDSQYYGY